MTPLPEGFGLALDPSVRVLRHGTVLVGGRPGRLMTLSPEGARSLEGLLRGDPMPEEVRRLGRRLVDAGMAHPRPPVRGARAAVTGRVTVVVPVLDRPAPLDECLASLRASPDGTFLAVVVVDDGSARTGAIAEVCDRHGARLVVRGSNGGPAAARNDSLATVDTELVAFLDSDCAVHGAWLAPLVWLFDDPLMGAVAPRVRPAPADGVDALPALARFSARHSDLDMGGDEGEVGPVGPVRYVPAAALVVRRSALGRGFDESLRIGEDVDFVWRLRDRGWRVRYVPAVEIFHREPRSWRSWLGRRFRYGTSAGPLALRHPGRLAPVTLRPLPTAAAAAILAGRPRTALALMAASAGALAWRVRSHGIPPALPARWSAGAVGWTVIGIGHATTMLSAPALAAVALRSRRSAICALALALAAPGFEWWRRRPELDPARWAAACIADDVAYGAGVWVGCLRSRSAGPLVPSFPIRRRASTA